MMKVPYTVILLEETTEGPDFFTEVAEVIDLAVDPNIAIREAHYLLDQQQPRVRVVGILKGNFAANWVAGSVVKGGRLEDDNPRQPTQDQSQQKGIA